MESEVKWSRRRSEVGSAVESETLRSFIHVTVFDNWLTLRWSFYVERSVQ